MNDPFPGRSPTVPSGAAVELFVLGTPRIVVGGVDMGAAAAQPKRLALLAYLAVSAAAGTEMQRRDLLVALLWPELDQEHARTALRKALHAIRERLGPDAIRSRGTEEVGVDIDRVRTDVVEFERALAAGRPAEALAWYRGDLLDGFFVSDAPAFERAVDQERARLRGHAAAAAWAAAAERERAGEGLAALQLARRAVAYSPDDETALRRLISLLDRMGDRAGAVRTYEAFAKQLAEDLAVEPSVETQGLIEAVRQRVARLGAPPPEQLEAPAPSGATMERRGWTRFRRAAVLAVILIGAWGTRHLWAGRGLPVTTRSRDAYERYVEGTADYARGDFAVALRALERALAVDSTFAMAAYYAGLSASQLNDNERYTRYFAAALRLAPNVTERERLLIRATWAQRMGDGDALVLAESLAARHPEEPAGHDLLGRALLDGGDFIGAVTHLAMSAAADSASLRSGAPGPCRACESLLFVSYAYWMADSLEAAERVARDLVRRRPGSAEAWHQLAATLETEYRFDEALAANNTGASLRAGNQGDAVFPAMIALRAGRLREAERILRALTRDTLAAISHEARWGLVIALRQQGRLADALVEARRFRREMGLSTRDIGNAIPEAQVLFELGRYRAAAALFDSIGRSELEPTSPARVARNRAWHLTHIADALAALGDTLPLAALADSIESAGVPSGYGRDHLLHHHARGLLQLARGRPAEATAEFERATFSWTGGLCRNNLDLARALLALGRAAEAAAALQAALHGPAEAGGLYCTFTELHAELGRAFAAAGERDSAVANYRWAQGAWANADPAFAARRREINARLAALGNPH